MSDCRFGVSPVNYPDPDPEVIRQNNKAHEEIAVHLIARTVSF